MLPFRRLLRRTIQAVALLPVLAGCSAVGLELPNYGFYGFAPRPDGAKLKMLTVSERAVSIVGDPPAQLGEAAFQLDTVMVGGQQAWLLTRQRSGQAVLDRSDSIWLDRWTLKPIATWGSFSDVQIRQYFNRRSVVTERITSKGRRSRARILLDAEPYAEPGIELVMATMPLSENYNGALPLVLTRRPTELHWLRFRVAQKVFMPGDNGSLRATWVVEGDIDGVLRRYWVDADDRTVVKWEEPGPDGATVRWIRGRSMPRLQTFEVERIGN
ncbi:MAG: hypothetical protein ABJC19_02585 [Gemmatimonadota bacterium]